MCYRFYLLHQILSLVHPELSLPRASQGEGSKDRFLPSCILLFLCFWNLSLPAQSDASHEYRNFPLVITLQFHNLSLPFRDMKSNFTNIGLGLGSEFSLNGDHNWVQQFNILWYRNKAVGNGLMVYTQTAWRPAIASDVYTELKLGAGYLLSSRPVKSYRQINGVWESAGRKGKGMLAIPAGLSVGYNPVSGSTYLSPFVSYQSMLLSGYSTSIPLVPETLIQVGSRIHFK